MSNSDGLILGSEFSFSDKKVIWNPNAAHIQNGHTMIVGASGSGKTTLLKTILTHLHENSFIVYVIDLHGDLGIPGETHFEFTTRESQWALNPFEFEMDHANGGPKAQVDIIVKDILKKFIMRNMGDKQESVLRRLVLDTYRSVGIYDEDPSTWKKTLPTTKDLYVLFSNIYFTLNSGAYKTFLTLFSEIENIRKKQLDEGIIEPESKEGQEEEAQSKVKSSPFSKKFEELAEKMDRFSEYCKNGANKDEFYKEYKGVDFDFYDTPEKIKTLGGMESYIETIAGATLFNGDVPTPTLGVNRYDISGFTNAGTPELALAFAKILVTRIFRANKIYGKRPMPRGRKVHTFIVIDESKMLLPQGKEKDNPFDIHNRLSTEVRKFGVANITVSQRVDHFSDDILSNMHTKIVLNSDANDVANIKKRLGVKNDDYFALISKFGTAIYCEGRTQKLIKLSGSE